MSLPEKEFLSKKKCIYEVICYPDARFSIERRAVIYLNKKYVYVKVPGNDELVLVSYSRIHDTNETEILFNGLSIAQNRGFETCTYFWDRPDTISIKVSETLIAYLQKEINKHQVYIRMYKADCEDKCRIHTDAIEELKKRLEELEEK